MKTRNLLNKNVGLTTSIKDNTDIVHIIRGAYYKFHTYLGKEWSLLICISVIWETKTYN